MKSLCKLSNDFCDVCLQREVKWPPGMSRVLERTAINLQGLEKHMWLLIVDAFSKWVEVEPSDKVINRLYWKLEHPRRLSPPAHTYIAIFELDRLLTIYGDAATFRDSVTQSKYAYWGTCSSVLHGSTPVVIVHYRVYRSSSSPPQPKYLFENPLTSLKWSLRNASTAPKNVGYDNLRTAISLSHNRHKIFTGHLSILCVYLCSKFIWYSSV